MAGGYGDKSIKWVNRVVLTNDFKANDSDAADFNADVETATKTKARFINAPKEVTAGKPAALTGFGARRHLGDRQGSVLRAFPEGTVAGRRPVLDQSRLEGRGRSSAARGLGRWTPGRKAPRQHEPNRSGKGDASGVAATIHSCPLGGIAPRHGGRDVRLVLPYHRPQRHRSAAAAPAPKDRRQRHTPRHRGREGLNHAVTPRRRIGNSRRVARRLLGPGAAEACRGVPCRWRSGKPAFRYLVPALRFG